MIKAGARRQKLITVICGFRFSAWRGGGSMAVEQTCEGKGRS